MNWNEYSKSLQYPQLMRSWGGWINEAINKRKFVGSAGSCCHRAYRFSLSLFLLSTKTRSRSLLSSLLFLSCVLRKKQKYAGARYDTIRRRKKKKKMIDILNISCVFVSIQLPIGIEKKKKKKKKKMRHVCTTRVLLSFRRLPPSPPPPPPSIHWADVFLLFTNCAHRNVYSTTSWYYDYYYDCRHCLFPVCVCVCEEEGRRHSPLLVRSFVPVSSIWWGMPSTHTHTRPQVKKRFWTFASSSSTHTHTHTKERKKERKKRAQERKRKLVNAKVITHLSTAAVVATTFLFFLLFFSLN